MPVKLTPKGAGFALKPSGNGGVGALRRSARRARSPSDSPARAAMAAPVAAGEQQRVEPLRLHHLVDAVGAGEREVLGAIRLVARRGPPRGPSRRRRRGCDWPYLIAPRAGGAMFQFAQLGQRLDRRRRAERASHALKSRFMPYLKTIEQSSSLPLALRRRPRRSFHCRRVAALVGDRPRSGCRRDRRRSRPAASGPRSPRPSPRPARRSGRRAAPSPRAASVLS